MNYAESKMICENAGIKHYHKDYDINRKVIILNLTHEGIFVCSQTPVFSDTFSSFKYDLLMSCIEELKYLNFNESVVYY